MAAVNRLFSSNTLGYFSTIGRAYESLIKRLVCKEVQSRDMTIEQAIRALQETESMVADWAKGVAHEK